MRHFLGLLGAPEMGGGERRGVGYGRFVERKREKSSYFEIPKVFMPEKKSTFGPEINIVC